MSRQADLYALSVKMDLQTAAFNKGVASVNKSLNRMDKRFKKTGAVIKNFAVGLGAAFSVRAITQFSKGAVDAADRIDKMSKVVGLSVESFQKLSVAADLSGVNVALFESSMVAFTKRVGEASAGMGPLTSGLQKMDKELLNALTSARSQEEALGILADAIKNAAAETDEARILNAAFGRSGIVLGNMLRDGKIGLDELTEGIKFFNAAQTDAASDLKTKWTREIHNFTVEAQKLALEVLPSLSKAAEVASRYIGVMAKAGGIFIAVVGAQKLFAVAKGFAAIGVAAIAAGKGIERAGILAKRFLPYLLVAGAVEVYQKWDAALSGVNNTLQGTAKTQVALSATIKKQAIALADYKKTMGALPPAVMQNAEQAKVWNAGLVELEGNLEGTVKQVKALYKTSAELPEIVMPEINMPTVSGGGGGAVKKLADDMEAVTNVIERQVVVLSEWEDIAVSAINSFASSLSSTLVDGIMDGKFAFEEFAKSMLSYTAKMIIEQTILNALFGTTGGGFSWSNVVGAITGGATRAAPALAGIGQMSGIGTFASPTVESFGTGGMALPSMRNDSRETQGGNVSISQNFDFRGAQDVQLLRAESERIKNETLVAVEASIRRGGSLARLVGRKQ